MSNMFRTMIAAFICSRATFWFLFQLHSSSVAEIHFGARRGVELMIFIALNYFRTFQRKPVILYNITCMRFGTTCPSSINGKFWDVLSITGLDGS